MGSGDAWVAVGVAVGVGAGDAPGLTALGDGVGVGGAVGGSGCVGQFANSGLNVVGDVEGNGLGDAEADPLADAEALAEADALGEADGLGDALTGGVVTYGVYDGQGGSVGMGGACAPAITSEIATAIAPTSTVTTNVTAPHSRRQALMRPTAPGPSAQRHGSGDRREPA